MVRRRLRGSKASRTVRFPRWDSAPPPKVGVGSGPRAPQLSVHQYEDVTFLLGHCAYCHKLGAFQSSPVFSAGGRLYHFPSSTGARRGPQGSKAFAVEGPLTNFRKAQR